MLDAVDDAARLQVPRRPTDHAPAVGVRLPILVTGVTQPRAMYSPTSALICMALGMPDSSCGLQLANVCAQSMRPPRIRLVNAKAAAAPLVMPHLSNPVATRILSLPGRMGPT